MGYLTGFNLREFTNICLRNRSAKSYSGKFNELSITSIFSLNFFKIIQINKNIFFFLVCSSLCHLMPLLQRSMDVCNENKMVQV